jgi:hypothetical protein
METATQLNLLMHENCYDVKLPCPFKEIVYKVLRNGKQKGSLAGLPFLFLSVR